MRTNGDPRVHCHREVLDKINDRGFPHVALRPWEGCASGVITLPWEIGALLHKLMQFLTRITNKSFTNKEIATNPSSVLQDLCPVLSSCLSTDPYKNRPLTGWRLGQWCFWWQGVEMKTQLTSPWRAQILNPGISTQTHWTPFSGTGVLFLWDRQGSHSISN